MGENKGRAIVIGIVEMGLIRASIAWIVGNRLLPIACMMRKKRGVICVF